MYRYIFLDLDDTILDFHKAEAIAVAKAFSAMGFDPTEDLIQRYSQVNKMHWEMMERGEINREAVLVDRFAYLFRERGLPPVAEQCKAKYESLLGQGHYFLPGAEEILPYLAGKYRLFLASNGTASVQNSRLDSAGIRPFFEKIFISEHLGANKPSAAFFQACFAQIPDFDPSQAIIIGDSLTSDMRGGNNAGIRTCWYNPNGAENHSGVRLDYEIRDLLELKTIL